MGRLLATVGIAVLAALFGCTITEAADETGSGKTGAGGGFGGAGGGAPKGPCGAVPVTGECATETRVRTCLVPEHGAEEPRVVEVECTPGDICKTEGGWTFCGPDGDCRDGQVACKGEGTLRTCVEGAWDDAPCPEGTQCTAQPGTGVACSALAQESGTGPKLRGRLSYEYLAPNDSFTGFSKAPTEARAIDFFVTVYDGGELLGMGLTSPGGAGAEPGEWEVSLTRKPTGDTFFYFWPILFDDGGNPFMAIARPHDPSGFAYLSKEYWVWGFGPACDSPEECGVEDTGEQLIRIEDGSGAAHLYQWLDFSVFRMRDLYPGVSAFSLLAFWEPGEKFNCHTCFLPPGYNPHVAYDEEGGGVDSYVTGMVYAGTEDSPMQWSASVITHEYGHYVMAAYSKSPLEAAPHSVTNALPPGMAYSEGWATFSGQSSMSNGPGEPNSIFFSQQDGTAGFFDVAKATFNGTSQGPPMPDPNGPMDQPVSELVVTAMMWSFWAEIGTQPALGLGDGALFPALRSKRILGNLNRGYGKVDFVDFLDAMQCEGLATASQVASVTEAYGYPYGGEVLCP